MARAVVCAITGKKGNSDEFVKIKGKYYESQETYDTVQKQKDLHGKIVDTICFDFLSYRPGQVFPTMLPKKLNELSFYDNEVILQTIENNAKEIQYWLSNKQFDSDSGKIAYMFAIVKANINGEYAAWVRRKSQEEKAPTEIGSQEVLDLNRPTAKGKNIAEWLEEDEV